MTENEAMEELKNAICDLVCIAEDSICRKGFERLDNAGSEIMDCLDRLAKYESIGTVERFEQLLKQFAPHNVDETSCYLRHCNKCDMYRKENEKYHSIGTVEELQELKERSVAKKVVRPKGLLNEYYHEEECPNCKAEFKVHVAGYRYTQAVGETHHCPNCGQKLSW